MRRTPDFALWLSDIEARRQTRNDAAEQAESFQASSPISQCLSRLSGISPDDHEAILDSLKPLFEDCGWTIDLVANSVALARQSPMFTPPFRAIGSEFHTALLLVDTPLIAISLGVVDADSLIARKRRAAGCGSINFSGRRKIIRFVRGGGAVLSIWDQIDDDNDGHRRCVRSADCRISDGDTLHLDTTDRSFVFEHIERDAVLLQAEIKTGGSAIASEFDAKSGRLVRQSAGEDRHSRAQLMATFLRQSRRRDAVSALETLTHSEPFFVRWHAMREWLALDRGSAAQRLQSMAKSDGHPEVRDAAGRTLTLLEMD